MKKPLLKLLKLPSYAVSSVTFYEVVVKYTGVELPNLTAHLPQFVHDSNFLTILTTAISTAAILLSCYFLSQRFRRHYYKYCPECAIGVSPETPGDYCQCGTKYLEGCPKCSEKIGREFSSICAFCGHNFPVKSKIGHEWMGR